MNELYGISEQVKTTPPPHCPEHKKILKPGIAIENTYAGEPDFIGDDRAITMHPGGMGKVIRCLKCPDCGFSVYE